MKESVIQKDSGIDWKPLVSELNLLTYLLNDIRVQSAKVKVAITKGKLQTIDFLKQLRSKISFFGLY